MTSIVRSPKNTAKGWQVHTGPRSNIAALIEAADREADEQEGDTERFTREARERVQQERMREGER